MQTRRLLAILSLSAALGACALAHQQRHVAKVTPIPTPAPAADQRSDDGLYAEAVRAINARDYADALEDLEAARERDSGDVRVPNAFGVVYDKLGRFDLSARYYAQAAALDPASQIVSHNLAYSALLQRQSQRDAAPALAAVSPRPAPGGRLVQIAPGVTRLEAPIAAPPVVMLARGLAGRPLALVDASGGGGGAPVRLQLARLGWSTPMPAERAAPVRPRSQIVYSRSARVVALSLARTLPGRVDMVACATGCEGVRLVLGADSLTWKHPARRQIARRV